jgi:REP element-mobilizing transposase RayT
MLPRRHSMRLQGYDYSQAGAYFITICTQKRQLLFVPDPVHDMIEKWWGILPSRFANIELDAFVVMPNHIHGIFAILDDSITSTPIMKRVTMSRVVQWFKTMTTNEYIRNVKQEAWHRFDQQLWQRDFWDHIVRNDADFARLRSYIENNPVNWHQDELYA